MEEKKDKKLVITSLDDSKEVSQVLANDTCRAILNAVTDEPLSATQIAEKMHLPLTTVDYNLKKLQSVDLIGVDHRRWSPKGKKVNYYAPKEKFIVITPSKAGADVMQVLKSMLPIIALIVVAVGIFAGISLMGQPAAFVGGYSEDSGIVVSGNVSVVRGYEGVEEDTTEGMPEEADRAATTRIAGGAGGAPAPSLAIELTENEVLELANYNPEIIEFLDTYPEVNYSVGQVSNAAFDEDGSVTVGKGSTTADSPWLVLFWYGNKSYQSSKDRAGVVVENTGNVGQTNVQQSWG